MAKGYAVNGMVVGRVVYAGVKNNKFDSGSEADEYSLMFVSPEGVTFSSRKRVFTVGKDGVAKQINKFTQDWINSFYDIKDTVDRNKGIKDKDAKENVFVKANLYPSKDGKMWGSLSAKVNDKNERIIRLDDVCPQKVDNYKDEDGNTIIKFGRDEYLYKVNGRKFSTEKKSESKFEDILTRFKVSMIAREVNEDEITFVADDGEYAAVLETYSTFDNSRVEIGQGYEFEVIIEKGATVEVSVANEDEDEEDFGWDSEASESTFSELPSKVRVFLVKGKVEGYNMTVSDDFLGNDDDGGF
ncbi:MAG: hypothetical protein ACRDD8_05210 [Bacteroidales bacterium]